MLFRVACLADIFQLELRGAELKIFIKGIPHAKLVFRLVGCIHPPSKKVYLCYVSIFSVNICFMGGEMWLKLALKKAHFCLVSGSKRC